MTAGYCFCTVSTHYRWSWHHGAFSGTVVACSRLHAEYLINQQLEVLGLHGSIEDHEICLVAWSHNENLQALPLEHQVVLVMR